MLRREKKIRKRYGFNYPEVKSIVKHRPSFLLVKEEFETHQRGIRAVIQVLSNEQNISKEAVRQICLKYPPILGKSLSDFANFYDYLQTLGIEKEEATKLLFECPKIISIDLKRQF